MIKLIDILTEITEDRKIKSIEHYQQLLNISNGLSQSTAKYFQDVINSVKKQNEKATDKQLEDGYAVTEKQYAVLQRIKTGNFNPSTKN
jgi:hypothetical protein